MNKNLRGTVINAFISIALGPTRRKPVMKTQLIKFEKNNYGENTLASPS